MRLKNKHTGQEIGGSYIYWRDEVLSEHKEINYEILTHPDLVDVMLINPKNGKKEFIETLDRYIAKNKYLKDDSYTAIDTDLSKFDELYRLKEPKYQSFIKRILSRIKQIIKPKKNPNKIPFSRSELMQIKIGVCAIAIAIIIPIVLFIIDKSFFS